MMIKNSRLAKLLRVNGIVLYPFIFFAPKDPNPILVNHELIHVAQIKRLGVIKFYTRYLLEYLKARRAGLSHDRAYRAISFEREAYDNAANLAYLEASSINRSS